MNRSRRRAAADFEAARTTPENKQHWSKADSFSADAANRPDVRCRLRARSRYEAFNNSYARGIIDSLTADTIGTGPRLQLLTRDLDTNQRLEMEWSRWSRAIQLPDKLSTIRASACMDGACFALKFTNHGLAHGVKLDIRPIEDEQVSSGINGLIDPTDRADGIRFDAFGNPTAYHLLDEHPGDLGLVMGIGTGRWIDARYMVHFYRPIRPGQSRGLPEMMSAIPMFAQLRRFSMATLMAAETAADYALFLKTTTPPAEPEPAGTLPHVDIERNMAVPLPEGWEPYQLKAEHPATTYEMFKREILSEIARCICMSYNIASLDSSRHNYASGRMDHQLYRKSILITQERLGRVVLDSILHEWLVEAAAASILPRAWEWEGGELPPHQWHWDGAEHVDPWKEASATTERLNNNTTTLAAEWAKQNRDWRVQLNQRAEELRMCRELGIPTVPGTAPEPTAPVKPGIDEEEEDV